MAITNIHILTTPDDADGAFRIAQAALTERRIEEHRRGQHPWGSMRRDCPFCQQDK